MPTIRFTLNGQPTEASYEPGMHLLEVLREECGVTSAKNGCAPEGACGCCLVMIDGRPALSCLRKPEQMDGHQIVTLDGIPEQTRRIIADAFVLEGGVQCGFCIPGIVVRAASLIEHGKTDDRDAIAKALDGHICRCTGYGRIIDAIQTAGEASRNGGQLPEEPRRHHFFGEDFGLHRNPKYGDGQRRLCRRLAGAAGRPRADARREAVRRRHARAGHAPRRDGADRSIPRAKVLKIQTEAAAAMPGVVRVFTAADVPGTARHRPQRFPTCRCSSRRARSPAASPIFWRWSWPTRSSTRARRRRRSRWTTRSSSRSPIRSRR